MSFAIIFCLRHHQLNAFQTLLHKLLRPYKALTKNQLHYDSSELGEELVSSSLSLRVHKVYIRVSFSDTFLRWLPPFVTNSCHYQQRKNFPFYTLLGSGCVLISYSMLSLIIAWLGQDYSSEAETADKETLLYCAVSPHRM